MLCIRLIIGKRGELAIKEDANKIPHKSLFVKPNHDEDRYNDEFRSVISKDFVKLLTIKTNIEIRRFDRASVIIK